MNGGDLCSNRALSHFLLLFSVVGNSNITRRSFNRSRLIRRRSGNVGIIELESLILEF